MQQLFPLLALFAGLVLAGPTFSLAQAIAGHPEDYAPADIAYGAKLYGEQCVACHGANGDGVAGIDFKRGSFHTVVTDRDHVPGDQPMGCRARACRRSSWTPTEITGIVAYIRNFNAVDRASIKLGDAARGKALFEGKGQCAICHRVDGVGPRAAPDLERRGGGAQRRVDSAQPAGPLQPDDADQPSGAHRHQDGRTFDGRRLNEDTYSVQIMDSQEAWSRSTRRT